MAKKILAISYDRGVGNALVSSISKFNGDKKLETIVLSEGPSRIVFDSKLIPYKTLRSYGISDISEDNIRHILEQEKPDIIFTGFSDGVMLEKYAISTARFSNTPSITVLEGYTQYLRIVSDPELKEPFKYMPDYIFIIDELMLEDMLKVGFPRDKLIITGNPYFDDLFKLKNSFTSEDFLRVRKELDINENAYLVTFFSQAIIKVLNKGLNYDVLGYNELSVLGNLEEALSQITIENLTLLIKLHDKEDLGNTKRALQNKLNNVIFDKGYDARKTILATDLVTGMFSTSLLEAVYLDKDVVSVQPGLIGQDTLITNKLGLSIPVYREENLKPTIEKVVYDLKFRQELKQKRAPLKLDGKATERVVNQIYSLLNVN